MQFFLIPFSGTYAPSAGFSECKECVIGSYCNDTGLFEAVLCPPGYYCPTGSIVPKPCKAVSSFLLSYCHFIDVTVDNIIA